MPGDPELGAGSLQSRQQRAVRYGVRRSFRPQDQSKPVGEAPISSRPEIAIIPEQGGVLTHRGQLVIEPSIQYTHTSQDRFFFQGFEVVDTVLIGLIEATKAERNTVEAALGARLGVTDRLELEARIPYVYRNDQISRQVVSTSGASTIQSSASGNDIGDVEFAAHYDFTNLIFDQPYNVFTIANLKVKTPTGESPFDVPVDPATATRRGWRPGPASGPSSPASRPYSPAIPSCSSGQSAIPSISAKISTTRSRGRLIVPDPSDPTSCPASSTTTIGEVDPGDSFNASVGMGLSLNERASVSLGFSFDYVFETTQKVSGTDCHWDAEERSALCRRIPGGRVLRDIG